MSSDAPYVMKAEYPVYTWEEPHRITNQFIYRDKDTVLKFYIFGR